MKPLKCKTYLSTISLRVLESVGISETIVLQGVPVNNVLGVCVCVQESVGITVKPLKCKAYLLTMSLVCVCVQESVGISETIEVQGVPVNNVLGGGVCTLSLIHI